MAETASAVVDDAFIVKNVRLLYTGSLFTPQQYQGAGEFKYDATLGVPVDSEAFIQIQQAIKRAAVAEWGEKAAGILKQVEGQKKEFCFIDGNLKDAQFDGLWVLSCKRRKKAGPPKILDRDKSVLTEDSGRPYGGCFVNAKIRLWAQNNEFGKTVRAEFITIQFIKDGDAFSGGGPATDDGFEVVESDADDLM